MIKKYDFPLDNFFYYLSIFFFLYLHTYGEKYKLFIGKKYFKLYHSEIYTKLKNIFLKDII